MPGKTIKEPCCICGKTKEQGYKLMRVNEKVYCSKHAEDIRRYGYIRPSFRNILSTCCVCGNPSRSRSKIDGKEYCQKHYMQLYHHGHLLNRTIFDGNEYIDHPEEGYTECIMYTKSGERYVTLIDLDKKEQLQKFKISPKKSQGKVYAMFHLGEKKYFVHRFLMNVCDKYDVNCVIDHINGNSLDNRMSNLRICTIQENSRNIRKKNRIVGVSLNNNYKKWQARIMSNYHTLNLGVFDVYEEAVFARIKKEQELFGEYGPNKDLFYVINHPTPIEELKKVLSVGV